MTQVTEEKVTKTWVKVDAQTNQKDDIKRERVFCLDDENETEVQADDTIQGETPALDWTDKLWPQAYYYYLRSQVFATAVTSFPSPKWIKSR